MKAYTYQINENTFRTTPNLEEIPKGVDYEEIEVQEFEEIIIPTLALHHEYSELIEMNYKTLMLDNLENIRRDTTLANKGLKGEKKYYKGDVLIWSSEKKYWFEDEELYGHGFTRITRVFDTLGNLYDSWNVTVSLSEDDKEMFKEEQRKMIFNYFKSQQPELFQLLYVYFKEDIDRYVMNGGELLADVLTAASISYPSAEIVQLTLNSEVATQSGGTIKVLDGILNELV